MNIKISKKLQKLIPIYLKNRRQDIISLQELLCQKKYKEIKVIGHNIKGSGLSYGFKRITDIGTALEQDAIDQNPEQIQKHIQELSDYIDNIEITFV